MKEQRLEKERKHSIKLLPNKLSIIRYYNLYSSEHILIKKGYALSIGVCKHIDETGFK